jgi:amphi-Trp domain-containing protein
VLRDQITDGEVWVLRQAMKRHKIKRVDERSVQACVEELQALIDGLKAGRIHLQHDQETLFLGPVGLVSFELRVDQTPRKETLRVELSWRPEAESAKDAASAADLAAGQPVASLPAAGLSDAMAAEALPDDSTPPPPLPSERVGAPLQAAPERDVPLSTRALDRMATAEYQRLYEAARTLGSDGQWHLDQDQLIVSLALAGVDPLTQQELYALALQADADGRGSMLSERVIEAIKRVSQPPPPLDGAASSSPAENA